MALIKLGALAQDVRGSLNGTTFSRNKGGAYVRSKVSPVQPVSPYSANSRQAFKQVAQTWAALLTASDRAAWIAFAALHPFINVFGDSIQLSGIAFYSAAMKRLQQLGFPIFDTPPAAWDCDPPGAIAPTLATDAGGNIELLINPVNPPSGGTITAYLFATPVLAPGVTPQNSDFRLINDFSGTIQPDTFDWGPLYKARFGGAVPPDGAKIAIKYAYLDTDTGCLSVPSGATILAAGVPGPVIDLVATELVTAGGGLVTPFIWTAGPHGWNVGDVITFDTNPVVPVLVGSLTVATVVNETEVTMTNQTGSAAAFAANTGTAQRTG